MSRNREPQGPPPITVSADHYAVVESQSMADVERLIRAAREAGAPEDAWMKFGSYYKDIEAATRVHWQTGAGRSPHPESMGVRNA